MVAANPSGEEALALTAKISNGVARGVRGKGDLLKLAVPAVDPRAKDAKPFAHPKYWAAFILIGDPN
jgi:CHAT domain-containing protein